MEKITEILDKLDLAKFVPELDKLLELALKATRFAVRVGPMCILLLGIIYLFLHPNEANHKAGYRTFFGMGSLHAWRFTQRVSGFIMILVGLFLNGSAKKAAEGFSIYNSDEMISQAFALIKVQILWAVIIFVFMALLTAVMFNAKGKCRFKRLEKTGLYQILTCNVPKTVKRLLRAQKKEQRARPKREYPPIEEAPAEEEPEENMVYERQGEQSITADDIVIDYQ